MKQPAGIWVLFLTEMWERFSYYGMRALLVLVPIGVGCAVALLSPWLKRWMHGVH